MTSPAARRAAEASRHSQPCVSVIVPVRDGAHEIRRCVEALLAQSYPEERREILVIDNGSRDATREIVAGYPVTLLVEDAVASPYVARNLGLKHARGEVLAFTDADCAPLPTWLEAGVAALELAGADLVGGEIRFGFSARPGAGEIFDAISNADNERCVAQRGVAKTGNLFATRRVFDAIGPFRGDRRSGGDVDWTGRASRAGFRIVYDRHAAVDMPALPLRALLRKQYRVGRGQRALWRDAGQGAREIAWRTLRGCVPHRPSGLRPLLARRGPPGAESRLHAIWLVGWLCTLVTALGRLRELAFGPRLDEDGRGCASTD